jgi:tetratricopeptide (TPR) repeat protein
MSRRVKYIVHEVPESGSQHSSQLLVGLIAGLIFGALGGYLLGAQSAGARAFQPSAAAAVPVSAAAPTPPPATDIELQSWRNVLANDPANVRAAVELGNKLYDAGRFTEAIPYYQRAMTLSPKDINVSTDLGTSLWNAGRADDALAQFDRSLAIDAKHPQTLFNIGIVKLNGKKDAAGALAAWERLIASNPGYPDQPKVRQMMAEARAKLTTPASADTTPAR